MQALTDRHRPRTLSQLRGQGAIVWALTEFSEAPYSAGFVFSGPTGTGKTSAAHALARDLGVSIEDGPFGGWWAIKAGEQTADSVREVIRQTRTRPMGGSGWRVILIDEADRMSAAVQYLWLGELEDLPPMTLVVFTTNHPDKFDQRFRDRCEAFAFASDGATLMQDAEDLARSVWAEETGSADGCPCMAEIQGILDSAGAISFRRVVMALAPALRAIPRVKAPAPVVQPIPSGRRDLSGNPLPPIGTPRIAPEPMPIDDDVFALAGGPCRSASLFDGARFVTVGASSQGAKTLPTEGVRPMGLGAPLALRGGSPSRKPIRRRA